MAYHLNGFVPDRCPACGRPVLVEGEVNRMEAALDANGEAPVVDWLDSWLARPRRSRLRRLADLIAAMEDFADHPERLRRTELNVLSPGLWELKVGTVRLPFTAGSCAGAGGDVPRRSLHLPRDVRGASSDARCARATHGFVKRSQRTPRFELDRATAIAREDAQR